MLGFLLDEHISPVVAEQVADRSPNVEIHPLLTWQGGLYLGFPDEVILQATTAAQLVLVTYDQKSIPSILWTWGEQGQSHSGIIFVDYQSMPPQDFGGLVQALFELWRDEQKRDWTNRLLYLKCP